MTTKHPRTRTPVSPSTQDPVQRWLDIFVPMTGLPRSRAEEIRAELEDHLRARVDDLMITGLTEPEAVQQAVNELGETAHLAKQFRSALKPHPFKTNRNTLMHAALIAIAGSALTFGILSTTNSPAHLAPQAAATASLATTDTSTDAIPTDDFAFAGGGTIDLRTATLGSLFQQVRNNIDRPLVIHWNHLEDIGITNDQPLDMDADPVPTPEALRLAITRTRSPDFGGIAIIDGPEVIEITTDEYHDLRTKQIRPHDVADLIHHYEVPDHRQSQTTLAIEEIRTRRTAEQAGEDILNTIKELTSREDWVDFGGELASAHVVGNSLVIDAPARIHAGVQEVIEMMEAEVTKYQAQQREAQKEMVEAKQRQLAQLVSEMDSLTAELSMLETMLAEQQYELNELHNEQRTIGVVEIFPKNAANIEPDDIEARNQRIREVRKEISEYMVKIQHFQTQAEDKRAYRKAVRERLINLKYEPLLFEQELTAKRNRENAERRAEQAAIRNGSN